MNHCVYTVTHRVYFGKSVLPALALQCWLILTRYNGIENGNQLEIKEFWGSDSKHHLNSPLVLLWATSVCSCCCSQIPSGNFMYYPIVDKIPWLVYLHLTQVNAMACCRPAEQHWGLEHFLGLVFHKPATASPTICLLWYVDKEKSFSLTALLCAVLFLSLWKKGHVVGETELQTYAVCI